MDRKEEKMNEAQISRNPDPTRLSITKENHEMYNADVVEPDTDETENLPVVKCR